MEEKIAKIISALFHPLLIPTYAFLILFSLNNYIALLIPYSAKLLILSMVFITTFLFPLIMILLMIRKGIVNSLHMETKEERVYPIASTAIFYFLCYYIIRQLQISEIFHYFLFATVTSLILTFLINFKWKISLHMLGIGGLLGALIGVSIRLETNLFYFIVATIMISGIIGFARLKLKSHNSFQIYLGFLLGSIVMMVIFLV